jgi:hypothetical protein
VIIPGRRAADEEHHPVLKQDGTAEARVTGMVPAALHLRWGIVELSAGGASGAGGNAGDYYSQ